MSKFHEFATAFAKNFAALSKGELYRVGVEGQYIWEAYLDAFPEGTNEIYRVRREHDGSYDRNVVRRIGNVVAVVGGEIKPVWDIDGLPYPYDVVCRELVEKLKGHSLSSLFRINERKLGYVSTTERLEDGSVKTWNHFHVDIADRHYSREVDSVLGNANTTVEMFVRAAGGLKDEALTTVLELISENALYRGEEFKPAVLGFQKLTRDYRVSKDRGSFLWTTAQASPFARFRNTAIGTLVTDLSEGVDLEVAVKSFETKVAPTNYKRPTALITAGMVQSAMKTVTDLGLESALDRRYAVLSDVSVNNVLWVNGQSAKKMKGGLEDILLSEVKPPKLSEDKAQDISVDEFLRDIVPKAANMEVLLKNSLQGNLMSLTAPAQSDVVPIFKWGNNFGWSYKGDITDSIKERVKKAGGNVAADLRVSLAWFNGDDLDLHSVSPYGHVYFGDKAGILDVDMNVGGPTNSKDPVENQSWVRPRDGVYRIKVDQYSRRSTSNVGFQLEVECNGVVRSLAFDQVVHGTVTACSFAMKAGVLSDFRVEDTRISHSLRSQEVWGVKTETFVPVSTLLLSPNHWDDNATGNKHWFFILEGCQNPEGTRGIYNEFLRNDLDQHRKVFEVLGSKTRCPHSTEQLSGLGFSSTQEGQVIVRVTGSKINKLYNVKFN